MDEKPYKLLADMYKLFVEAEGKLTERQIGFMTGSFKTLLDIYSEPDDPHPLEANEPKNKRFNFLKGE